MGGGGCVCIVGLGVDLLCDDIGGWVGLWFVIWFGVLCFVVVVDW